MLRSTRLSGSWRRVINRNNRLKKLLELNAPEIIIRNEELLKRNYTGKFRQVDGLDYALEVLQRDVSFTVQHDEENRRLTIE